MKNSEYQERDAGNSEGMGYFIGLIGGTVGSPFPASYVGRKVLEYTSDISTASQAFGITGLSLFLLSIFGSGFIGRKLGERRLRKLAEQSNKQDQEQEPGYDPHIVNQITNIKIEKSVISDTEFNFGGDKKY